MNLRHSNWQRFETTISPVIMGGLLLLCIGCGEYKDSASAPFIYKVLDAESEKQADASATDSDSATSKITITLKHPSEAGETAHIKVTGLEAADLDALRNAKLDAGQWTRLLAVTVGSESRPDQPAMLGQYRIEDDSLLFVPRFPLQAGLTYRAVFDATELPNASADSQKPIVELFPLPKPPPGPPTIVENVYPSSDSLPENQLKFYIHFSASMSRGEAYERIRLLDAAGKTIEYAFLELGEELWDPRATRFTLFIDPGRIKRGLKPREDLGPVLEAGKSYTLVIDRDWLDAAGNPLKASFEKRFQATEPDETQPVLKQWKLFVPRAGTTQPLVVSFGEPLDHAMLGRVLLVKDALGQSIPGHIDITAEESTWHFRPRDAWRAGKYSLDVEATLEDLAGNSIARRFEVDMLGPIKPIQRETVGRPFVVQPAGKDSSR